MKVIFLDHDGVICLETEWGTRHKKQREWGGRKMSMRINEIPIEYRFDNFNKKAVKVLNEILEKTNAEIVVSSDWRFHATLEELGELYTQQGIIKKPIGVTEEIDSDWEDIGIIPKNFQWISTFDLEQNRHFEIKKWLFDHPNVKNWVAIDDLDMGFVVRDTSDEIHHRDWGLENFVWTNSFEGIKKLGTKEKIINILNNGTE
jgi:hypothetical protein